MTEKPDWWPKNPYPIEIFPMPRDEYQNIVPDPHIRTALSGMLGREFWEIASGAIWDAMQNNADDENAEMREALKDATLYFKSDQLILHPWDRPEESCVATQLLEKMQAAIAKAEGK